MIATATLELESHSPAETKRLARRLARLLQPGDVILLEGPFGAGKTVFVQGLAGGLGIKDQVSSPSFILVNEYHNHTTVYHADLYRISGVEEAVALGLEEYVSGRGIFVVEWPERVAEVWPAERLWITFIVAGKRERKMIFQARGDRYVGMVQRLARFHRGGAVGR